MICQREDGPKGWTVMEHDADHTCQHTLNKKTYERLKPVVNPTWRDGFGVVDHPS